MTPGEGGDDGSGEDESSDASSPSSLSDLAAKIRERQNEPTDWAFLENEGAAPGDSPTNKDDSPSFRDLVDTLGDREMRRDWASFGDSSTGRFGSDTKTEAVMDLVGDATNVLLLGPLLCPADHDLCSTLLSIDAISRSNLLLVTLSQSPDERLNVLRSYLGELPNQVTVLDIGDPIRSGSSSTTSLGEDGSVTIETISDPTDIMRVGITISRQLSKWNRQDAPAFLCFHSLTSLLQFVDDRRSAFRFIHVLQSHVNSTDARAHYHMDANAHDQGELETFRPLFDVTLRFDEDGSVSIDR